MDPSDPCVKFSFPRAFEWNGLLFNPPFKEKKCIVDNRIPFSILFNTHLLCCFKLKARWTHSRSQLKNLQWRGSFIGHCHQIQNDPCDFKKTKSMFFLLRATNKRSNEWSRLLLRACQKCYNVACCCCSLKKKKTWPLTPVEPSCSIHSVSVSMTVWRFTTYLTKLAALSLLIYCSVVFFFFFLRLCSYFLYKTNVSVVKKRVHIKKQMIIVNIVCSVLANDKVLNHYKC